MSDLDGEITSDSDFEEEVEIEPREFSNHSLAQLKSKYGDSLIKFNRQPDGQTGEDALHYAIKTGEFDKILFLLEQKVDVLRNTERMLPPLTFFVASCCHLIAPRPHQMFEKHREVFEKMLQAGADPFQSSQYGLRLLTAAVNTPLFDRCLEIYKVGDPAELQIALDQALWTSFRDEHLDTIIRLKKLGAVGHMVRAAVIPFEPKMLIELTDTKESITLKLEDMNLNHRLLPPGSLVVFYLAGHDMKAECSDCVQVLMRPECQCSDLISFVEKNQLQIESLCSPNPLATNQRGLIRHWSFYIFFRFVFDQCVALQAFDLPILVMTEIVKEMLDNKWPNIAEVHYHQFLVVFKYFHDSEKKNRALNLKNV